MLTLRIIFITLFLGVNFSTPVWSATSLLVKAMTDHLSCYPVELISLRKQQPVLDREDVCLAAIYHELGTAPFWVTDHGPSERAATVLKFLRNGGDEGLDPENYQVDQIERLWLETSYDALAQLDTLITYNLVKYVHDVSHGQLKTFMADPKLFSEAGDQGFDPVATIQRLVAVEDLDGYLGALPPDNIHYQGLKNALTHFRELSVSEGWQEIASGKSIYPGMRDDRMALIRSRLALFQGGDLTDGDMLLYDDELEKSVLRFQKMHGLVEDGIIGRYTLAELNISPARRIEQIKMNMARWRWQDHDLGDEYILVNIANYQLYGYRHGELALQMPVIVGKFQHQTPVFSDRLRYVEFNPFWNVPPSIAKNEELPELQKNPNYLVEKNIRLFSNWQSDGVELDSTTIDWSMVTPSQMARYKLRQDPGPDNALGRVKFVFPNHYSVYLHDTPAKNLFSEVARSFSHGCIRVADPERLALFALQEETGEWTETSVNGLFATDERRVVRIRRSLPIHITYQTAWLDKEGGIHFNRDVYARDSKLYKALQAR